MNQQKQIPCNRPAQNHLGAVCIFKPEKQKGAANSDKNFAPVGKAVPAHLVANNDDEGDGRHIYGV